MCRFLETIAISPEGGENIPYHQERVDRTFRKFFPNHRPIDLREIVSGRTSESVDKCRVVYDGTLISVSQEVYTPKKIATLRPVHLDTLSYSFKFADRSVFQKVVKESHADEVIIIRNGFVTDASYANLAFLRNGTWYTPINPLLHGAMRQNLIDQGLINEDSIHYEQIHTYEQVLLINAMLGFNPEMSISVRKILPFL